MKYFRIIDEAGTAIVAAWSRSDAIGKFVMEVPDAEYSTSALNIEEIFEDDIELFNCEIIL